MFWTTIGEGIIFTAAVAGSIAVLWKWPLGPLYKRMARRARDEYRESVEKVVDAKVAGLEARLGANLKTQLDPIRKELEANGGESVKDLVVATHGLATDTHDRLEAYIVTHRQDHELIDGSE